MSWTDPVPLLILGGGILAVALYQGSRPSKRSDRGANYREEVQFSHSLPPGPVHALLFRRSGDLYLHLGIFRSAEAAMAKVMYWFNRARIDGYTVLHNTPSRYVIARLDQGDEPGDVRKLGRGVIVPAR